jgi:Mg-chelatase subunit ChlD
MTSYFATAPHANYWRLLLLFSLLYVCTTKTIAAEPTRDIRIVVDISGSMKKNDPYLLRQPAIRLLADLLPKGTQAGVWTFGKYVNMLVPLKPVTDEWRVMAKTRAAEINSIAAFTNIGEAIETASAGWQQSNPNSDRHLILLTDGWVDISKSASENHQARQQILNRLLPTLKNNGVKFHTLALANDVDKELLQLLAANSQGSYHEARHADDLLKVFVNAFDQSVKPQQVPIEADGFHIDSGINEFTALIFKKTASNTPVTLITPEGKRVSAQQKDNNVKWLTDAKFDLITINAPNAGKWQLMADLGPSSRVTIISDLSLQVKGLRAMAEVGSTPTLEIMLTEKGKTITREDFLRLLTLSVKYQQGEHFHEKILSNYASPSHPIPSDGIYHFQPPEGLTVGEHQFSIEVDGQTFKRVYKQTLQVISSTKKIPQPSSFATPPAPSSEPSSTPSAIPIVVHTIEPVVADIENSDYVSEPSSETEEDDFFSEPQESDEANERDADAPPEEQVDNTHQEKTTHQPLSQRAWFKWAIASGILFANILLFSLGTLWYRRATKRELEDELIENDQLKDDEVEEDEDNLKEDLTKKIAALKNKTTSATPPPTAAVDTIPIDEDTSAAAFEKEIADSYEGDILEDPLKDLHADEFDNDLDMPDEDHETRT